MGGWEGKEGGSNEREGKRGRRGGRVRWERRGRRMGGREGREGGGGEGEGSIEASTMGHLDHECRAVLLLLGREFS